MALAVSLALGAGHASATGAASQIARTQGLATAASTLATSAVFNCADAGPGSLRQALLDAAEGATIDMSQLSCSLISLTSGELAVARDNLTLIGPGRSQLLIRPAPFLYFRVFNHTGSGTFSLSGMSIRLGFPQGGDANGGCIESGAGSVTVSDSRVYDCFAESVSLGGGLFGGGAIHAAVDVTVRDSEINGNQELTKGTARCAGGGIFAERNLILSNVSLHDNACTGPNLSYGGGAAVKGNVDITSSSIFYNLAGYGGYGFAGGLDILDFFNTATATITNSTISGNTSEDRVGGIVSAAPITIRNSTIAFNKSVNVSQYGHAYAGGLLVYSGMATLQSTIIASNTVNGNLYDFSLINASVQGANNLIMGSNVSPPNTLVGDPKLVGLADNGGPTKTHALAADSPAIAKGNDAAGLVYDQRGPGYARMFARKTDIGAFQSGDSIFNSGFDPPQ